jgi:hypothetical protein
MSPSNRIGDLPLGSPVVRRVAIRLHDYLSDIGAPLTSLWPLVDRVAPTHDTTALEQRRVRIVLAWGIAVVSPAATIFLNMKMDPARLDFATRSVSQEIRRAVHVAGLDSPQARDLAVGHVFNAVFAAFTWDHTRPLDPAVRPLLMSGLDLLSRLIDLTPESDDSVLSTWTPVVLAGVA